MNEVSRLWLQLGIRVDRPNYSRVNVSRPDQNISNS